MKAYKNQSIVGIAALILVTMVAYGCGGGGGGGTSNTGPTSSANFPIVSCATFTTVTVQDFSFTPANITISVNDVVKWINNGPSAHSVTSGTVTGGTTKNPDGNFDVPLSNGATVCIQFLKTGTYPYYCNIHPSMMQGSVTVQ